MPRKEVTHAFADLGAVHSAAALAGCPRGNLRRADSRPVVCGRAGAEIPPPPPDRKSTRLNSSHSQISYAVFCLKKKKEKTRYTLTPSAARVRSLTLHAPATASTHH